tara:strand:- start:442 stop:879 length:438 start_codon:yes stop_codon:yes gene_type:complete
MSPDAALTAIIARLEAAGLTKAKSPLGVSNQSAPQFDRSFSVKMDSLSPATRPDRGKATAVGLRVINRFTIELSHRLTPNSGQTATSQALQDLHRAWKYLSQPATTLTTGVQIRLGASNASITGSGAYFVQAFGLDLEYNLTLAI